MQDVRFAIRSLIKNPGFAAVVILTLALGIGANTAVFSLVNGALIRPLPYPDADRIAHVSWLSPAGGNSALTLKSFSFLKENANSFEAAAAYSFPSTYNLWTGQQAASVEGLAVSEDLLRVLAVSPFLGRGFLPEENRADAQRVVILSHSLWQNYFSGDPEVLGRNIELNSQAYTVIGILPQGFSFTPRADVWLPLMAIHAADQGENFQMLARIKSTIDMRQAQSEIDAVVESFREQFPDRAGEDFRGVRLDPYQTWLAGDERATLLILLGAVGLVLLIACANVANLLLARATLREREIAVRAALGANRWRILRLMITESLLLAAAGGVAGLLAARWITDAMLAINPQAIKEGAAIDFRVLIFALVISLITGIVTGLVSSLKASRGDLASALKQGGRAVAFRHRLRSALIITEVALSLVLLAGASLLIRSLFELRSVRLGFDPRNVWAVRMSLPPEKYKTSADVWNFEEQVIERLKSLPGVRSAAAASSLPPRRGLRSGIRIKGNADTVQFWAVSPHFFEVMGIPIHAGRAFLETDVKGARQVMMINEALAQRYWPNDSPIGDDRWCARGECQQIVGVAGSVKMLGLKENEPPVIFLPQSQMADAMTRYSSRVFPASFVVKSDAPLNLAAVRKAVSEVDATQPVISLQPMSEVLGEAMAEDRFYTLLIGSFAAAALALTMVGLYGVMSYLVSQRTREIGIRLALGASRSDVLRLIVGQGAVLALAGVAIGLAASVALTRLIESLLFKVGSRDPATFLIVSSLLFVVALAACYIPARRAARVDPQVALRCE
ncbi:MAG: ABC transporter permease [Acidobacteriota bacterium]